MPVQIGAKSSSFSDPTGLLFDCHRRIEMFLKALQSVADLGGRSLNDEERRSLEGALRYFREAAPKHNADEEESLFPRLRTLDTSEVRSALADVARLEEEHRWAEPLHAEVDRLGQQWLAQGTLGSEEAGAMQSAIGKLQTMYRTHIEFEDRILFPLASRVLSPVQRSEIAGEMATRRNLAPPAGSELRCDTTQSAPKG